MFFSHGMVLVLVGLSCDSFAREGAAQKAMVQKPTQFAAESVFWEQDEL